jgi:hypothetical protein
VSGPLLFIIYVDELLQRLDREGREVSGAKVRVAAFADDITVWATGPCRTALVQKVQKALTVIEGWADCHRMVILGAKTEAILLTTEGKVHRRELDRMRCRLHIAGADLEYKSEVKLLGVVIDSGLTFKPHAEELKRKVSMRIHQLGRVAGTDWGAGAATLRSVYVSYIRSVLEYGSVVWYPMLSHQAVMSLEARQLSSARIITGCIRSTERDSLLLEASLHWR